MLSLPQLSVATVLAVTDLSCGGQDSCVLKMPSSDISQLPVAAGLSWGNGVGPPQPCLRCCLGCAGEGAVLPGTRSSSGAGDSHLLNSEQTLYL